MSNKENRLFTIKEQIRNIFYASKSFVLLRLNRKSGLMNKKFKERIMLSITEVNGCAMCSYVHTKIALSTGMSEQDIQGLLNGDSSSTPLEETVGVIFAQHFAYSKENPSDEAIQRLVEDYGYKKAELVLAACNMITMTNAMGISMDNLYGRLRLKKVQGSRLYRELFIPLLTMVLFPTMTLLQLLITPFKKRRILDLRYYN